MTTTQRERPRSVNEIGHSILGESSVFGLLGPRRRGKSLAAAFLCAQAANRGVRVLHRGNLAFGELLDVDALLEQDVDYLANTLVYLDEVQEIMDSRRGMTVFQVMLSHGLIQSGHMGMSILWTSQDEARLSRDLKFQTDFVFYVDGRSSPFESRRHGDLRCPGFFPDDEYYEQHINCPKLGHRRVVRMEIVAQRGALVPPGSRVLMWLHCAQRYYELFNTRAIINSAGALTMNSDTLREKRQAGIDRDLVALLRDLPDHPQVQNPAEMTAADIASFVAGSLGIDMSSQALASRLSRLGVPRTKESGRYVYDVLGFVEDSPAA